ncbi:MAG: hypothetical protein V2A73_08415, partial [Pseudomonadota bacterium]
MFEWLRRRGQRLLRREERSEGVDLFRRRYASFRRLLGRNSELLALLADLETDLRYAPPADPEVQARTLRILDTVLLLIQDLNDLTDGKDVKLFPVHERLDQIVRQSLRAEAASAEKPLVVDLADSTARSPDLVGGKAANLAELRTAAA